LAVPLRAYWHPPELLEILRANIITKKTKGTVKSDVFSQGLVFGYYILQGRHPYPKGNIDQHILDSNPAILEGMYPF
jgi:serine/threonine protein kinase